MFYLILVLGLVSMAAGVFIIGFAAPIRETAFGSSLLIVGSICVVGGFVLLGIAAAVVELRNLARVMKSRPVAVVPQRAAPPAVERKEMQERRPPPPPPPPRVPLPARAMAEPLPPRPVAEAFAPRPADPLPPFPPRPVVERSAAERSAAEMPAPVRQPPSPLVAEASRMNGSGRKNGPEWLKLAMAEIEAGPKAAHPAPLEPIDHRDEDGYHEEPRAKPESWQRVPEPAPPVSRFGAPPSPPAEPRPPAASAEPNIFDMVWPTDRRRNGMNGNGADRPSEAAPEAQIRLPQARNPEPRHSDTRHSEVRHPEVRRSEARQPVQPPPAAAPPAHPEAGHSEARNQSVLKSGVIDEMAYTLFTDGSIEANMPEGSMRFASIDDLRSHLEKYER